MDDGGIFYGNRMGIGFEWTMYITRLGYMTRWK